MEGNERITLYPPNPVVQDSYGQPQVQGGTGGFSSGFSSGFSTLSGLHPPVETYARRQDRGGREALYGDQKGGAWSTRFEVRRYPSLEDLSERWVLSDSLGRVYDIEAVTEAYGKRVHYFIYATRRAA